MGNCREEELLLMSEKNSAARMSTKLPRPRQMLSPDLRTSTQCSGAVRRERYTGACYNAASEASCRNGDVAARAHGCLRVHQAYSLQALAN